MSIGTRLREHVDRYCGQSPSGVVAEDSVGLKVATFRDTPDKGLMTALTVGLSGHELSQTGARKLRQELLVCVDQDYAGLPWAEILFAVGKKVIENHKALLRGEVLGPAGPLFPEATWCNATALICSGPAFFDREFAELTIDNEIIVFVELIPITTLEARAIVQEGWRAFFDQVNDGTINILDLRRT